MADLDVILASGDLTSIEVNNSEVVTEAGLPAAMSSGDLTSIRVEGEEVLTGTRLRTLLQGLPIPEVDTLLAANGTIFYDPTENQLRYKTANGQTVFIKLGST